MRVFFGKTRKIPLKFYGKMKLYMNEIILSIFLGPLFLAIFFLLSLATVAGIKIILLYFNAVDRSAQAKKSDTKRVRARSAQTRRDSERKGSSVKPAAERSIEIDPDQVDKIYVKKIS